ncbi:hypothetical protein K505DRAFT_326845 [Melanomma pulvis-pyrius CBS 109.77]|uniref:Uncharacterized protein n=1 Tax=Melanomma pulvis-pyrius CBS 109.77 TaxID=1314802 RepID=A0A6A6X571_9PLEO|nr:hypothetical protein K505DRAFT_326845 [Melanomma pulvis-pyrius CBS 109.77]
MSRFRVVKGSGCATAISSVIGETRGDHVAYEDHRMPIDARHCEYVIIIELHRAEASGAKILLPCMSRCEDGAREVGYAAIQSERSVRTNPFHHISEEGRGGGGGGGRREGRNSGTIVILIERSK